MFSHAGMYSTIADKIGWVEAGRILGIEDAAEHFRLSPPWRVRDAISDLLTRAQETRYALMQYAPPETVVNRLSGSDLHYATAVGIKNAAIIDDMIQAHFPEARSVLDFGCGTGRLLRFMAQFSPERHYSGCDVISAAVEHLRASDLPGTFAVMPSEPPAPFSDHSFDVVFAWSIFTHYSEAIHLAWLTDIKRMLKPGGLLLATVHSADSFVTQRADARVNGRLDLDALERRFNTYGFAFGPLYQDSAFGVDANSFGQAFVSQDYIARYWTKYFDSVRVVSAVPGWQDLVIMRKPS